MDRSDKELTTIGAVTAHSRAVAAAWHQEVSALAYIPYPAQEVRTRLEQLVSSAIAVLSAGDSDPEAPANLGYEIGRTLADLHLMRPQALEQTLSVLVREFAPLTSTERLGQLLAATAAGFTQATQRGTLEQQEAIGRAAIVTLSRARRDLEESHDNLARANEELSRQISERIRAEQTQRAYAERLERLHEITLATLSAGSLPDIVDIAIDFAQDLFPGMIASTVLYDADTRVATIVRSNSGDYPDGRAFDVTLTSALDALREGRVFYLPDVQALRGGSAAIDEIIELGGRSILMVPFHDRGEFIGVLTITAREVREFTTGEVMAIREVADTVTIAIRNRQLLEAERQARERETTLREVAASLTLGLDLDEVLQRILSQVARVVPCRGASVVLLENGRPAIAAQRGPQASPEQREELLAMKPRGLFAVLETGRLQIINDTAEDPDWLTVPGFEYIRSWMAVPLLAKGACIGALMLDRDQPNAFLPQEMDIAEAFANQAAIAIVNSRLFRREAEYAAELERNVQQRWRELQTLYGITAATVEEPDLESVLRRSLDLATKMSDCPFGAILLTQSDDATLRPLVWIDNDRGELFHLLPDLVPNHSAQDRALRDGESWIGRSEEISNALITAGVRACAIAPLRSRGRRLGVIALLSDNPHTFTAAARPLLTTIADQIGVAVENIDLRHKTRQAAIIEERERLAQDLHDDVTQTIYSLSLFAEAARESVLAHNLAKTQKHIETILRITGQASRELRLLLFELRTELLAKQGLAGALRERLRLVERRAGLRIRSRIEEVGPLPVVLEEAFYRIGVEALNNVLHHAQATQVNVALRARRGQLHLVISDDGIGFHTDTVPIGMGLEGMRKRIEKVGGVLALRSHPGQGVRVEARAPLTPAVNGIVR